MPAKSFLVKVELLVQKVSCPGVWLCSNGKVSLQFCMLDSTIQTDSYRPSFPIIFSEKFIFYKTFLKERRLNELQSSLGKEWLCAELIQWKNCDEGVVLASFQTTLDDLLYPSAFRILNLEGTNVDLLMEPTKLFPGTISPKLELRTKTTIEETICELKQKCSDKIFVGHTIKTPCFSQSPPRKLHPKRVCHTVAYSRAQQRCTNSKKGKRPIFKYRRPEDNLILRMNPDKVVKDDIIRLKSGFQFEGDDGDISKEHPHCYCGESGPLRTQENAGSSFVKSLKSNRPRQEKELLPGCPCLYGSQHEPYLCSVCSKYECTFSRTSIKPSREFLAESTNGDPGLKLCTYCRRNYDRPRARYTDDSDSSATLGEKKVCFCLPEEKTCNLAKKLHERLKSTVHSGATRLENCIKNCEVCE